MAAASQGNASENQPTDTDIDEFEFSRLELEGAILLTSFSDKFEFVPLDGYGPGRHLNDLVPFDYLERRIAIPDRKRPFAFTYIDGGEAYMGRFLTRVQIGKHSINIAYN